MQIYEQQPRAKSFHQLRQRINKSIARLIIVVAAARVAVAVAVTVAVAVAVAV